MIVKIGTFLYDQGNLNLLLSIGVLLIIYIIIRIIKGYSFFDIVCGYYFIGLGASLLAYNLAKDNHFEINSQDINLEPLLYCIVLLVVLAIPFTNLKNRYSIIDDRGLEIYFNYIALLLFALSVIPFIEGVVKMYSVSSSSLLAAYEGRAEHYSELCTFCRKIAGYFQFFTIPLLFYYLYKGKRYYFYFICLLFVFVTNLILAFVGGARGTLVNYINYLVLMIFIFESIIPSKIRSLRKHLLVFFPIVIVFLYLITMARWGGYANNRNIIATSISMYIGEGPLHFSQGMWNSNVRTKGDNSFSFFKILTGQRSFKDNNERREYWEKYQRIPNSVFYTLIGDIYSDIGVFGTVILCIGTSILLWYYVKRIKRRRYIKIQEIVILSFYFEWISMGIMTNCFKTYYSQFYIFITVLMILLFNFTQSTFLNSSNKVIRHIYKNDKR